MCMIMKIKATQTTSQMRVDLLFFLFFVFVRSCTEIGQSCTVGKTVVWTDFFLCGPPGYCGCNFFALPHKCVMTNAPFYLGNTNSTVRLLFNQSLSIIELECESLKNTSECITYYTNACKFATYQDILSPPTCGETQSPSYADCDCYGNGPRCILSNPTCSVATGQLLSDINQYCNGYCSTPSPNGLPVINIKSDAFRVDISAALLLSLNLLVWTNS